MTKTIESHQNITNARRQVKHIWEELERKQRDLFKSRAQAASNSTNATQKSRLNAEADQARDVADYAQDRLRDLGRV